VKALEAETDALASDRDSLTDAQRAAKEAEIEADLVAVQREEIALIAKAAADGLHIASRADCDPRAVLGHAERPGRGRRPDRETGDDAPSPLVRVDDDPRRLARRLMPTRYDDDAAPEFFPGPVMRHGVERLERTAFIAA
jgi:hypothetical protein